MRALQLVALMIWSAGEPVAPDAPAAADARRIAELSKRAKAVLDAYADGEPVFSRDGKRVLFVSTRDGLPQLYAGELARPTVPAKRITRTTERVAGALPLADGASMLFRSDRGGDENWSIFKIGIDGENLVDLTPGEKLQRDAPIVPEGLPDTMFFVARKMSEPASALYTQATTPGSAARRIYGEPRPGFLADVAPDGKRALWLRHPSQSEVSVVLVQVETGAARVLFPPQGRRVGITAARFAGDGRRALLTTDDGGDKAVLLAVDLGSGKEEARYVETRPATALLTGVCTSPKDGPVVVTVGAGDHQELRLLDAATLTPIAPVRLPIGSGAPGGCPHAFSADAKTLLVHWSTPQVPPALFAVETATGRVSTLRREIRPALATLPAVETSVEETEAFDGGRIPMLVYRPRGARGKLPVLVSYHGGPAGVSTARWNPQVRFFLSLGYAYVEPNVRGSSGYGRAFEEADNGRKRLDAFKDIETAARWVAGQPWADKERLVVFGGSYGGYTTLIALTRQPDLWRAGVNLVGVADVRTLLKTTSGVIRDVFKLEFGELPRDEEFLASISPIRDADKIVDPLFVYAGANDPRVPRSESDMIVAAARQKGIPVEYMVKEDEGHSLARKPNQIELFARSARFLEKHLGRQ